MKKEGQKRKRLVSSVVGFVRFLPHFVGIYCSEKIVLYIFITVCLINLHKIALPHTLHTKSKTLSVSALLNARLVIVRSGFFFSFSAVCFNLFVQICIVYSVTCLMVISVCRNNKQMNVALFGRFDTHSSLHYISNCS